MKKLVRITLSLLLVVGFSYLILFVISSLFSPQAARIPLLNDHRIISQEVEQYRPVFEKYAEANGIKSDTDLLMAIAMQESKGKSADIMQASESRGLTKDTIRTPEESIRQGALYFKKALRRAHGNVPLALQSYNFGLGFSDFVERHGGKMTPKLIRSFSRQKAAELGWHSYGDPEYASRVLRYYHNEQAKQKLAKNGN
ncbi:lysozyme family protein [Sporolactobacillus vineae]|uniref:lysozyme family protein n=1 Tax=Sporolactobacillus vineae TaxID=444463 RepID=UPI001EE68F0F|nr:lysozyme family protein [Sporolactobacillus vineae]